MISSVLSWSWEASRRTTLSMGLSMTQAAEFRPDSPHNPLFLVWFSSYDTTKGPQVQCLASAMSPISKYTFIFVAIAFLLTAILNSQTPTEWNKTKHKRTSTYCGPTFKDVLNSFLVFSGPHKNVLIWESYTVPGKASWYLSNVKNYYEQRPLTLNHFYRL